MLCVEHQLVKLSSVWISCIKLDLWFETLLRFLRKALQLDVLDQRRKKNPKHFRFK